MFISDTPMEYAFEFPRQVGKTELLADWIAFMYNVGAEMAGKPFKCIIFAPTKYQASQDYSRFRTLLSTYAKYGHELDVIENTKVRIEATNGNSVTILPLSARGDVVGASGNFLIFEEAQDLDDDAVENKAIPMGANFAATSIFIGTAGTKICYFYSLMLRGYALRYSCWQIIEMRRWLYEADGNVNHLNYEKNVNRNMVTMTEDNFGRQFNNKWLLGENQFMTPQRYDELVVRTSSAHWDDQLYIVYSVDLARKTDGCIITKLVYNHRLDIVEAYPSVELPRGSYADHYEYLSSYLSDIQYDIIIFDVTGNQSVLPDMLVSSGVIEIDKYIPFIFTQQSKHDIYSIYDQHHKRGTIRYVGEDIHTRFELSLLHKTYNLNGTMSVATPKRKGWHDDRPCSYAMGVYAIHLHTSQYVVAHSYG
jgi:hypothetical protein